MSSVAKRMMDLFAGCASAHGTHGIPEREPDSLKNSIKSTARTLREPVTEAIWFAHIKGERPLGIIPIREDTLCQWGSIDIDDYDVNALEVVSQIEQKKLPFVPCRSKSGGLHLFLFVKEFTKAATVQHYLREVAAALGYARAEIFPKQTEVLSSRGDLGNWMIVPYFGGDFEGRLCQQVGLKKTGGEQTVEEFLAFAEKSKVDPEALTVRPKRMNGNTLGKINSIPHEPDSPFVDGPPCLQHLAAKGIGAGMQNNALLMIGIYLKKKYPGDWQSHLEDANHTLLSPPGSAEGLSAIKRSLEKRDYEYTCKTEPMVSHCNSHACRLRKYGVGQAGAFPIISGLSKLDADPPIWFVDVEERRLEVSTDTLQNYPRFHASCMEKVNKCFMALKQSDWLIAVGEAMINIQVIPSPPEATRQGVFLEHLDEYLTNRQKGENREDLLRGRPWEDVENGRHYFQLKDLHKFLVREGEKEMTRGQMTAAIRRLGGDHKFLAIKNSGRNCWWVKNDLFEQREPGTAPPVKGVPI